MSYEIIKTQKGYELRHNIIMEEVLGRDLKPYEVVHHIDLNKTNDSTNNLFLCNTRGIHQIIHKQFRDLGRKLAIEFLRLGIITFDTKEELYTVNQDKFESILNIDEKQLVKILKNLKLTSKEKNNIKLRRKNSMSSIRKGKREPPIDRSNYDKTRNMDIMNL